MTPPPSPRSSRYRPSHLLRLIGPESNAADSRGEIVLIRHGWRDGLTPAALLARATSAKEPLARIATA